MGEMAEKDDLTHDEALALVEALAFYARPDTYHAIAVMFDRPCGGFADDFSEDHGDPFYRRAMPGARAREVLDHIFPLAPTPGPTDDEAASAAGEGARDRCCIEGLTRPCGYDCPRNDATPTQPAPDPVRGPVAADEGGVGRG